MFVEEFKLERTQSLWENIVRYNLTESGLHPYALREILTPEEAEHLLDLSQGYGWTNGSVELREAVANLYHARVADEVVITNGSAEANFILVWTMLDPGDELVMVLPNYMQLWGAARSLGVNVMPVTLSAETGWRIDLDALASAVTPRTRMISLCHPNNPTGAVMTRAEMDGIVEIASAVGAYLHVDEIYKGSELDSAEPPSFADLYEQAIVTNGLSKAMGLPGLRIGWLVGPREVIARAWHHKDYTSITTAAASEYAAARVLAPERRVAILERGKSILRDNLSLLQNWVKDRHGLFEFTPPQAGGMAFLRYHFAMNSTRLADDLREAESVFIVPGDCYGLDGYVRLGIGGERPTLAEGLERFGSYLARLPEAKRAPTIDKASFRD